MIHSGSYNLDASTRIVSVVEIIWEMSVRVAPRSSGSFSTGGFWVTRIMAPSSTIGFWLNQYHRRLILKVAPLAWVRKMSFVRSPTPPALSM